MHLLRSRSSVALVLFAAGCGSSAAGEPDGDAAWRKALLEHRAGTEAEFRTGPTSPLTAAARQVVRGPAAIHVLADAGSVRLAEGAPDGAVSCLWPTSCSPAPAHGSLSGVRLSLIPTSAGWTWEPGQGALHATHGRDGSTLAPGPISGRAVFRLGRFNLMAQPQGDSLVLMVHDPEREELRRFGGLSYFAPDRRYAVTASVERLSETETVTLPTTLRLEKSYRRYARLRFAIDGAPVELTAFEPVQGSGSLFVPFRDATSGETTYGGGRYLDLEVPKGDTAVVDFNRAYNPMCVYSTAYNCPIPPAENRLSASIEAGEKTFDH